MNAAERASEARLAASEAEILDTLRSLLSSVTAVVEKVMTQEQARLRRRLSVLDDRVRNLERRGSRVGPQERAPRRASSTKQGTAPGGRP